MLHGIDFILSENDNAKSPLYGKVDTSKVGAFGHSQGSMATVQAAADKRIVASVPIMGAQASAIRNVKGPTFLIAGEKDTIVAPSGVHDAFSASAVPTVYGLAMGQDHLMPGLDPEKIWDAVVGWFKVHLDKEEAARSLFYGNNCGLCNDPRWKLERKNL
jgi:dienelactone hydrolase